MVHFRVIVHSQNIHFRFHLAQVINQKGNFILNSGSELPLSQVYKQADTRSTRRLADREHNQKSEK